MADNFDVQAKAPWAAAGGSSAPPTAIEPPTPTEQATASAEGGTGAIGRITEIPDGIVAGGWTIRSFSKSPILNSNEIDDWVDRLGLPALPEMVFPGNHVTIVHEGSGFSLTFRPYDALELVDNSSEPIKVAYADEWLAASRPTDVEDLTEVQNFDWTYTAEYTGTLGDPSKVGEPSEAGIDYDLLRVQEDILYYDEVILFEDELGDNGESILTVRLRVMPSGFFILSQLFVRVDDVMAKSFEVRLHHVFGSEVLMREVKVKEASCADIVEGMGGYLADPTFWSSIPSVCAALPVVSEETEAIRFVGG